MVKWGYFLKPDFRGVDAGDGVNDTWGVSNKVEIDLNNVTTSEELHSLLKSRLGFPAFYGGNWDAFWDSITGLVELPAVIVFRNWQAFEVKLPNDAKNMKKCFDDMEKEFPSLSPKINYL